MKCGWQERESSGKSAADQRSGIVFGNSLDEIDLLV